MRGAAAASENITWSTSTWPQPKRLLSTIRTDASRPVYSDTSQLTQSRVSLLRPGRRAHDLAVDDEVDARLLRARLRGLSAEHEVVDGEVAPTAGRVVVHLELRVAAGELRDIPRLPVELAGLGAGRRAHDFAVDDEPHLERAVEPLAAAEEEREVVLADSIVNAGEVRSPRLSSPFGPPSHVLMRFWPR